GAVVSAMRTMTRSVAEFPAASATSRTMEKVPGFRNTYVTTGPPRETAPPSSNRQVNVAPAGKEGSLSELPEASRVTAASSGAKEWGREAPARDGHGRGGHRGPESVPHVDIGEPPLRHRGLEVVELEDMGARDVQEGQARRAQIRVPERGAGDRSIRDSQAGR